jgi:hypothetical protein
MMETKNNLIPLRGNPWMSVRAWIANSCSAGLSLQRKTIESPRILVHGDSVFWTRIRNEKGSIFVIVYWLIIIVVAFGAAFFILSTTENRTAVREKDTNQAFYIAEAGIERALYDLREDLVNDSSSPSWADGNVNGYMIGPDTNNFYAISYSSNTLNGGSYSVQIKNVSGDDQAIWVKSTGILGDITQTIQVYAKMYNVSPWNNAIFAGAGASGAAVNGNVNIRGSVHILGSGLASTDYAVDLGGTAELVGNNYNGLESSLAAKVPALSTIDYNGETVETLNAQLRVKVGIVGINGSSSVGEADVAGNSVKETVDAVYVTDGFGGNQGSDQVYSDNGWSNAYDLGDSVTFPNLSDPYGGYSSYQDYLRANALVISNASDLAQLADVKPTSSFSYSDSNGSISMDGNGNLTISGIVYIDGGSFNTSKAGSDKTINYTGEGSIFATGDVQIDTNLVTSGDDSFPNNILGIMTLGSIGFNEASINVMGVFYAADSVVAQKQTDIMGTIVSNYFDFGTNVPSIYQVPSTVDNLPPGLINPDSDWYMKVVLWQRL